MGRENRGREGGTNLGSEGRENRGRNAREDIGREGRENGGKIEERTDD